MKKNNDQTRCVDVRDGQDDDGNLAIQRGSRIQDSGIIIILLLHPFIRALIHPLCLSPSLSLFPLIHLD